MIQTTWKGDHWFSYDLQRAMTLFREACRNAHFRLVADGVQPTECFTCHAGEWAGLRGEIERLSLYWNVSSWENNSVHFSVGRTLEIAAETSRTINDRGGMAEAGRLLGYPDCCVTSYSERCQARQSHLLAAVLATPGAHEDKQGIHVECFPECWPLSGLLAHELSFIHPCNLQCEGVRAYVRRTLALVDPHLVQTYMGLIQPVHIELWPGLTTMATERLRAEFTGTDAEPMPAERNAVIIMDVDIAP